VDGEWTATEAVLPYRAAAALVARPALRSRQRHGGRAANSL